MKQSLAAIGFDRRVRSEWLDAIASKQVAGVQLPELRRFGQRLLRSDYPGDEARGKTLTVIFHLWVDVPERAMALREAALKLFAELDPDQRLALHWGLSLATYPFFRDVADATGRLMALQDRVSLAQLQRRLAERWGERSTIQRAAQRVVRSWIDWGVLAETEQRGTYSSGPQRTVSGELATWVTEAMLVGADTESQPIAKIRSAPQLFPFNVSVSASELRCTGRLVVHRQGIDEDVVALQPSPQQASRHRRQLSLL